LTIVANLHDAQHIQSAVNSKTGWKRVYVRGVPCNIKDKTKYMLSKSQVKYIQSLGHKKFRDEEGVFIAEGPKIVKEIINEVQGLVVSVYAVEQWINENQSLLKNIQAIPVETADLDRISQLSTPNSVVAIVKKFDEPILETKNKITLALDTIQDPGNLGTIIRAADWFGTSQIVCSPDCADMYNAKVVQATMGSIARVKVMYADLEKWIDDQQVKIYAASLDGKDIRQIGKPDEAIILIGNESRGIGEQLLQKADEKMTIAKRGKAESLNAAVAAGIILSHLT
jgi:TrmH family RNA methyltransferase